MRRRVHTNHGAAPIALMCALALLTACGGEGSADEKEIRGVIEDAFTGTGKGRCTRLATQAFIEQSELNEGRKAVSGCEEDADKKTAESVDIENVDVDGRRATARFTLSGSSSGYREAAVALSKRGESWKLDRLTDISIDRDRFFKDARQELTSPPDAVPAAAADCVVEGYESYSDREIERAIIKPDVARLAGPVFPCTAEIELKKAIPPAAARCVGRGLDRGQRTGRLAKLLGDAKTFEELDQKAFQRELKRLVTICARRTGASSASA